MSEETGRRQSLVARLGKIRRFADALIKGGYLSLDKQAKALGLRRSTAWTIMKKTHKLGMLNNKTIRCILANPDTPVSVRVVIQAALEREKRLSEENTSRSQKV